MPRETFAYAKEDALTLGFRIKRRPAGGYFVGHLKGGTWWWQRARNLSEARGITRRRHTDATEADAREASEKDALRALNRRLGDWAFGR